MENSRKKRTKKATNITILIAIIIGRKHSRTTTEYPKDKSLFEKTLKLELIIIFAYSIKYSLITLFILV